MRNSYILFIVISLFIFGCATTSLQPEVKAPADAIIGHWKDALNDYSDHYFSRDGNSTMISPIGDHFLGTYKIVGQNPDDRSLELTIDEKIPGQDNIFHRRLLGKFAEDYQTFSGKSLTGSKIPFVFEYVDNQEFVPDAEASQLMKSLKEIQVELTEARTARAIIRENVANVKKDYSLKNRELGEEIEKLQFQIDGLQQQLNNIIDASKKQEEGQPTLEAVE